MEISWTTFLLEILNFLVLVWLLKRFLYRPVMSLLEKRRLKIQQSLDEAAEQHAQAIELEQQYKTRLEDWGIEKQKMMDALQQEIHSERTKRLEQLKKELASEREKTIVIEQRQQAEVLLQYQHKAHQQGARFASHLLRAIACEEIESHLIDLFIKSVEKLDQEQCEVLLRACKASADAVSVTSAFNLSERQQQRLQKELETLCKQSVKIVYQQDPELVAGLRIVLGASVLGLNLQDELNGFVELTSAIR